MTAVIDGKPVFGLPFNLHRYRLSWKNASRKSGINEGRTAGKNAGLDLGCQLASKNDQGSASQIDQGLRADFTLYLMRYESFQAIGQKTGWLHTLRGSQN